MSKKLGVTVLVISLVVSSLVFIGANKATFAQNKQDKVVKLKFWPFGGLEWEKAWLKEKTNEFNESHTNINVEYVHQSWSGGREKIISSGQLGTLADVFTITAATAGEYSKMGIIVPLNERFPEEFEEIADRIHPKALKTGKIDDKYYNLPLYVDIAHLATYNPTIIEEAGLDINNLPTNLIELGNWAKTIRKETGKPGWVFEIALTSDYLDFLMAYVPAAGMRVVDKETGEVLFDRPQYLKLLNWALDLKESGALPEGVTSMTYMDYAQMFFAGELGIDKSATSLGGLKEDLGAPEDFKWALTPFPKVPEEWQGEYEPHRGQVGAYSSLFISKNSNNVDAAWEFVKFMMSEEVLKGWAVNPGRVPVSKKWLDSEIFKENKPGVYGAVHRGLLELAGIPEKFPGQTEINSIFANYFQKVMAGKISPEKAMEKADKEAQKVYDQYAS